MKSAVLYGVGDIRVEDREIPKPTSQEVLIKVKACGVCGTDNSLNKGDYPANYPVIIGHEFSGDVVKIGDEVTSIRVGDRVTVDPNRVCHKCIYCRSGLEHLCLNLQSMGVHIDGADAEYCLMLESNVYVIPDSLTYEEAAFCEPLACAVHGVDLIGVKSGDTVVIIGAGGMGNLITQCVKNAGATNIIVSEPIKHRRDLALENGATLTFDPKQVNLNAEIRKIKAVGADVVIEVAGNTRAQSECIPLARKGGTVQFFGCAPKENNIQINPFEINDSELRILGSFNNQFATGRAVRLLASKKVRVDNLISHHFELKNYLDVFKVFGSPESLKLMVVVD
jgi:2-desacetyl-2-hydroxyethyl bacteriochlorophyllide A dehydrogenase